MAANNAKLAHASSLVNLRCSALVQRESLRSARSMDLQHPRPSLELRASRISTSSSTHNHHTPASAKHTIQSEEPNSPLDYIEELRLREYPHLKGRTYLDHGGTTLYAKSFIEEFAADLISNLYGNPHSASTPSVESSERVEAVRTRTLRFFNADPAEFDVIFVANTTAAIKLVVNCLSDHAASTNTPLWYGYHIDSHTSLVGVRETTQQHRCFMSDEDVDLWISCGGLGGPRSRQMGLFAYPGQSNMTGRRLPLSWPGRIRRGLHKSTTYTLLDAAALASTSALDLSNAAEAPDFIALSFYKIFGFPDLGGLIVRKDSAHALRARRYFGGGTVEMVISVDDTWHAKKDATIHDSLEDGTLPFHSILALDHAMEVHERLYGSQAMRSISLHTSQLIKRLYDGLVSLQHANGMPVCQIYKDESAIYGDPGVQGPIIAFNVLHADGTFVGYADVEQAADKRGIYVRSGSLCNPGGMATYLEWSASEMRAAYAAGHRCSRPTQLVFGKPTGVVRVSLGAMSNTRDLDALLQFLQDVYVLSSDIPAVMPIATATTSPIRSPRTTASTFSFRPPKPQFTPSSPTEPLPFEPSPIPRHNIFTSARIQRMRSVGNLVPLLPIKSSAPRRLSSIPLPAPRLREYPEHIPRPFTGSRAASPLPPTILSTTTTTTNINPHPLQKHPLTVTDFEPPNVPRSRTSHSNRPVDGLPTVEIHIRDLTHHDHHQEHALSPSPLTKNSLLHTTTASISTPSSSASSSFYGGEGDEEAFDQADIPPPDRDTSTYTPLHDTSDTLSTRTSASATTASTTADTIITTTTSHLEASLPIMRDHPVNNTPSFIAPTPRLPPIDTAERYIAHTQRKYLHKRALQPHQRPSPPPREKVRNLLLGGSRNVVDLLRGKKPFGRAPAATGDALGSTKSSPSVASIHRSSPAADPPHVPVAQA